jgi:hypothetical protein
MFFSIVDSFDRILGKFLFCAFQKNKNRWNQNMHVNVTTWSKLIDSYHKRTAGRHLYIKCNLFYDFGPIVFGHLGIA